jgi:hypothetical protein
MSTTPEHKRLLLVVIDGLGAAQLGRALDDGHAPHLKALLDAGAHCGEAVSPFPSLTPVCLATIVTGAGPDRHRIPSLSWFHRGQRRFVEYGSSFAAASVEGHTRTIEDVVLNLNHVHLADEPATLFETLEDAGHRAAAINYLVYRGRTRHTMKHDYGPLKSIGKRTGVHAVYGPSRFYWGELFGATRPMLPQVGIKRPLDWGAAHIARWLMRNTDTEFLLLYLGQHDSASHKQGPEETQRAIRVADRAMMRVIDSMGGVDTFMRECALVLCADHGQDTVEHHAEIGDVFDDVRLFHGSRSSDITQCDIAIAPSNRVAMAYRLHHDSPPSRWVAGRACESPAVDIAAFPEDGRIVVINDQGGELHIVRDDDAAAGLVTRRVDVGRGSGAARPERWLLQGDLAVLDLQTSDGMIGEGRYPDALARLDAAARCVNAGDVLLSAHVGWEFVDIGGGHHTGGSHGSLHRVDSIAPLVTSGLDGWHPAPGDPGTVRLADIRHMVHSHFGM